MIFTIGHSNYDLEKFFGLLKRYEVDVLVDVRSTPYSRYFSQFNRGNLPNELLTIGVKYFYAGNFLGGLSERSITDELFVDKINKVIELGKTYNNIVLMCSERDPKQCHRAYKLTPCLLNKGEEVKHILLDGVIDGAELQKKMGLDWVVIK